MSSSTLQAQLDELIEKRKNGELSITDFYHALLKLLSKLADELSLENINESQIKRQIPLLLAFLKSQISEMAERGH